MKKFILLTSFFLILSCISFAQVGSFLWYSNQYPSMQTFNDIRDQLIVGNSGLMLLRLPGNQFQTINSGTNADLISISPFGPRLITGSNGIIIKNTGGSVYEIRHSGVNVNLNSSTRLVAAGTPNPIRIFVVGDNGVIIRSVNNGDTWTQISSPVNTNLNSIFTPSSAVSHGWIAGDSGVLLRTTDAGENWNLVTVPVTQDLTSVFFTSDLTGYVVGKNGLVLKTTSGGSSWVVQNSQTTEDLTKITFIPENLGLITGTNSTIRFTTNGGLNWQKDSIILQGVTINGILTTNANPLMGIAIGENGFIFNRTLDTHFLLLNILTRTIFPHGLKKAESLTDIKTEVQDLSGPQVLKSMQVSLRAYPFSVR